MVQSGFVQKFLIRPVKKRILTLALKFMGISEGLGKGGTGQVVLARLAQLQGGNGIRQSCGKCSLPPEDTLMEVPFLTFYANLNDVCPSMAH